MVQVDLYSPMALLYPGLAYTCHPEDKDPSFILLDPASLIFLAIGFPMLLNSADIDSEISALTVKAMLIVLSFYLYFGLTYYIKSYYFSGIVIILALLFLRYLDYFEKLLELLA